MQNKKLVAAFLIISVFISFMSPAMSQCTSVVLQIENTQITVNGAASYIDAPPIIKNGRTLLPVRATVEALGGTPSWNDSSREVYLSRGENTVVLKIDSTAAYFNGAACALDTAPEIIGGRAMLPIRFIAESFGFSVFWDNTSKTVTITDADAFSPQNIPPFSGYPYIEVNGNKPYFTSAEITGVSFERYSDLDFLGRCGVCEASVGTDIMPTEPRGTIGQIKPSGWHTVKYETVDGKYLYNRCHLLGYQLTGENSNEKNLITGTRYLNTVGMLPFENKVADYVKNTGNHVMYRATPVFEDSNLLSTGVLLEGMSVEDGGAGVLFCVFCYNAQPGIYINYANGESAQETLQAQTNAPSASTYILNKNTKKFHYPSCSSAALINDKNRAEVYKSRDDLISEGYTPCGICKP